MNEEALAEATKLAPVIVSVNIVLVAIALAIFARWLTARPLTSGVPDGRQNIGEFVLKFFVGKARDMGGGHKVVRMVAPFLGTFFLLIFVSNLLVLFPFPLVNRPPTSFFGVTVGLALASVIGTFAISIRHNGAPKAFKHLVWPNLMQWVSEITDVVSLSLRLFGNIAGEYLTLFLVSGIVYFGIPLILHVLGFIPAFVQALVFTLLTASFVSDVVAHESGAHSTAEQEQPEQQPHVAADTVATVVSEEG